MRVPITKLALLSLFLGAVLFFISSPATREALPDTWDNVDVPVYIADAGQLPQYVWSEDMAEHGVIDENEMDDWPDSKTLV